MITDPSGSTSHSPCPKLVLECIYHFPGDGSFFFFNFLFINFRERRRGKRERERSVVPVIYAFIG